MIKEEIILNELIKRKEKSCKIRLKSWRNIMGCKWGEVRLEEESNIDNICQVVPKNPGDNFPCNTCGWAVTNKNNCQNCVLVEVNFDCFYF